MSMPRNPAEANAPWLREVPLPPPLQGVRVLDCTRYLPFSYGSQLLVELGAEVVKVEPPGGEQGRAMRTTFAAVNRGKRSVTLDLATAFGAEQFLAMVDDADVVYESFRPGVLDGFGLAPAVLFDRNPRLVLCSATGYGQNGPYYDRPGHDVNYLAVAGALIPGTNRAPALPGFPVADMSSGLFAAFSITAAIMTTTRTGVGQHLDLSMTDVALSMNTFSVASGLAGVSGLPWPQIVLGECPCYGVWQTSDQQWIALGNIEPKFWNVFVDELGLAEYRNDALAVGERARQVREEIAKIIAAETAAYWDKRLSSVDVCYSRVHSMPEVRDDPHLQARDLLTRNGESWSVNFPVKFSGFTPAAPRDVPDAGEGNAVFLSTEPDSRQPNSH